MSYLSSDEQELESKIVEVCRQIRAGVKEQTAHPTRGHLLLGVVRVLERYRTDIEAAAKNRDRVQAATAKIQALELMSAKMKEVTSWLIGNSRTGPDLRWALDFGAKIGLSDETAVREVSRRQRGRPATRKRMAVEALDLRLTQPNLTWGRIADRLCKAPVCTLQEGRHQNSTPCCRSLQREVNRLQEYLQNIT